MKTTLVSQLALFSVLSFAGPARSDSFRSPSTNVDPYLVTHLEGVDITSILTVDDGVVPKTGGGTIGLTGIPDGIGVVDGGELTPADPDHFYLLVNHELNSTQGRERDHGMNGAFVSKWKVRKDTKEVVEGDDLIKELFDWDGTAFVPATTKFDRMCSSDRPAPSALFDSASGKGSTEILYFNGEETSGGRAYGHVVTGSDAGKSYHLEHLGFAAFENVLLSPYEQERTVAALTDDDSDGEVYFYVGEKQTTGSEVEKAGMVGGKLYALAVPGKPYEMDNVIANSVGVTEEFELKLIGEDGSRPVNGGDMEARGSDTLMPLDPGQTFESLKMGGPEDGAWDTRAGHENTFYFVTKGTASNGITAVTRLWKVEFDDIADPAQGGTLTRLLDGPDARLGSLDNMCFDILGGSPKLLIQEDLGSEARLSKIWEYDIDSGAVQELMRHDGEVFYTGGSSFLTTNEESSGVVSLKDVLGEGWFASSIQVHTNDGLSNADDQVEHGQLLLFNIAGRGSDVLREKVVTSGDAWDLLVDGSEPAANWNAVGFALDAAWNKATDGSDLGGPSPAPIGYGEADGVLATNVVQPDAPRPAAHYFRREFDLGDPSGVVDFELYLKVDDGAVVFLNGTEVARFNMPLDEEIGNDSYASQNESAERDWKLVPINGEEVALQASGNVLAVSLHQENEGSSDIRLDAELFAVQASPDGPASVPVAPSDLAATGAATNQIDLGWTAQDDADVYFLERRKAGEVVWSPVARNIPGSFAAFHDVGLEEGTEYSYRLAGFNPSGKGPFSEITVAETLVNALPKFLEETFEVANSFGIFTPIDLAGPDRNFTWVLYDFGTEGTIEGNGFGGSAPTEDWLVLTDPVDLDFYSDEQLTFDVYNNFSGPDPEILYSTDYEIGDPESPNDPNGSSWTVIDTIPDGLGEPEGGITRGPFDLSAVAGKVTFAVKYESAGGAGGQSTRFHFDDFCLRGNFTPPKLTPLVDFEADFAGWSTYNLSSELSWLLVDLDGRIGALNNNFGSNALAGQTALEADDWLVAPPVTIAAEDHATVGFHFYERFGDTLDQPVSVLVSTSYAGGTPDIADFIDITPANLNSPAGSDGPAEWREISPIPIPLTGDVTVAFRYRSAGAGGGTTRRIGIDEVCIAKGLPAQPLAVDFAAAATSITTADTISFTASVSNGQGAPSFDWDLGDGTTLTTAEATTSHGYSSAGTYTVSLTVSDDGGSASVTKSDYITVVEATEQVVPEPAGELRIATFNSSLNRGAAGQLVTDLGTPNNAQAKNIAEIIQLTNADVILINEFDYVADGQAIDLFRENYLEVSQNGLDPIVYPYAFVAPSNTGVDSGFDLDNNGTATGVNGDAFGFGAFPGQYGMAVLSKYPIDESGIRTFQRFRWADMPGNLIPAGYYDSDELQVVRLSSKSHWDVPVLVDGQAVHVLASHPTPPVFDDGTDRDLDGFDDADGSTPIHDWNGRRNSDEIRFWADYVHPARSGYIYDDEQWTDAGNMPPVEPEGGLPSGARFVIVGDQNADPIDGDSSGPAISQLLGHPLIDTSFTPESDGAEEFVSAEAPGYGEIRTKTSSFNLRADYVLSSVCGLEILAGEVFWPVSTDVRHDKLDATDHRLVYLDLGLRNVATATSSFSHGGFAESAAEIVSYDPTTRRLFVSNAELDAIDVLDAGDPANLSLIGRITALGGGSPNSVDVRNGVVAVAVENADKVLEGAVFFFDSTSLDPLGSVAAGALPDMLAFSPDGSLLATANEGEPNDDYDIDPLGSVTFVDFGGPVSPSAIASATSTTVDFTSLSPDEATDASNKAGYRAQGARFFGQIQETPVREASIAEDLEPEYVAWGPNGKLYVTCQENNALAIFDVATKSFESLKGLGFKDWGDPSRQLDASNRDSGINFRNWPVFGMYQPDAIEAFEYQGETFLITANEGDARDYDGFSEEERIGDLTLDPSVFPDAATLQLDENLGRLTSTITGDTDQDGDVDVLYTYGARSFTIWNAAGELVFDSGDALERITAGRFPGNFNATNDENNFDNRSDDKGPEPEAIELGRINGRLFAFVGLERIGGVVIYDITNPYEPVFIDYFNNRDFSVEFDSDGGGDPAPSEEQLAAVGDLGPEGLRFIPAAESPDGRNLLAVANEVSGTTTVFDLDEVLARKFTVQVLHSSDNESAFQDPNTGEERILGYSAVVNGLKEVAAAEDIPTLHLTAGDHTLPGPFYLASEEVTEFGHAGLADIAFFNAMNLTANGIGNHEFDGGINDFAHLLAAAEYPFIAANLDFSSVELEAGVPAIQLGIDGGSVEENAGKVVKSAYATVGGERIGLIGRAPADFFNVIEDPATNLPGLDFVGGRHASTNQPLVSAVSQVLEQVDLLTAKGINKIILLDHAQDFTGDPLAASNLSGIDIIVAAGATGFQAKSAADGPFNNLRPGDVPGADYPVMRTDRDGNTVLAVNSDQLWTYVGNLIASFDHCGRICAVDDRSGPVRTDPAGVDALGVLLGSAPAADPEVVRVWNLLLATPLIADAFELIGTTTAELVGQRAAVRSRETNLGRLAADSTLHFANQYASDQSLGFDVDVALKNGGGIRSTITGPDIRRIAVDTALAFDNTLALLEVRADELLAMMENGVSRYPALDGRFPQLAGARIVFSPAKPGVQGGMATTTPSRIKELIVGTDVVVENFTFLGDPARTFGLATNSFLLTGGDGYAGLAAIENDGSRATYLTTTGEQDILEDYIATGFPGSEVDLPEPLADLRVANTHEAFLRFLADAGITFGSEGSGFAESLRPDGIANVLAYRFGLSPLGGIENLGNLPRISGFEDGDPVLEFTVRDGELFPHEIECSPGLGIWETAVSGEDYQMLDETSDSGFTTYRLRILGDETETTKFLRLEVAE